MIPRLSKIRHYNNLEAALNARRPSSEDAASLAGLASELRELGVDTPQPRISPARRDELLMAVRTEAAQSRTRRPAARIKGATMTIAAVAGAGLVVAGAANGSNAAAFVVEAARDIPGIPQHSAPVETAIEGEVVATRDEGRTLEVRSGEDTVVVEVPRASRDVTSAGTPVAAAGIAEGDNVRVTSNRTSDTGGSITAKKIEILPSDSAVAGSVPRPTVATNSSAAPTPTKDARPAVSSATRVPSVAAAPTKEAPRPQRHIPTRSRRYWCPVPTRTLRRRSHLPRILRLPPRQRRRLLARKH